MSDKPQVLYHTPGDPNLTLKPATKKPLKKGLLAVLILIVGAALMLFMLQHHIMDHAAMDHDAADEHSHANELQDVSTWENKPTLILGIEQDAMSGWNLHLNTTHFRFAPEQVNLAPTEGEGHAHLYINEKKVARIYSPWFHIPVLQKGKHVIKVQLNANDHAALAFGENPIEVNTIVTVD